MPIKPENRKRYPGNWKAIRRAIMERAVYRCECRGICGSPICCDSPEGRVRCYECHGAPALTFRGKVVLTIAHLDHTPENCEHSNLRALCQRCHLSYDREHHQRSRKDTVKA